jgi:hypothetical protein
LIDVWGGSPAAQKFQVTGDGRVYAGRLELNGSATQLTVSSTLGPARIYLSGGTGKDPEIYFYGNAQHILKQEVATGQFQVLNYNGIVTSLELTSSRWQLRQNATIYTDFNPQTVDGAATAAYYFDTANTLGGAGTLLALWRNGGTERAHLTGDGSLKLTGTLGAGAIPDPLYTGFFVGTPTARLRLSSATAGNHSYLEIGDTAFTHRLIVGRENSVGASLATGGQPYAGVVMTISADPIHLAPGGYTTLTAFPAVGPGRVLIGDGSVDAAAALQVNSTTRGFLPPRMTTVQRDAISTPPDGLILYDATTGKFQGRQAGAWADLGGGGGALPLTGGTMTGAILTSNTSNLGNATTGRFGAIYGNTLDILGSVSSSVAAAIANTNANSWGLHLSTGGFDAGRAVLIAERGNATGAFLAGTRVFGVWDDGTTRFGATEKGRFNPDVVDGASAVAYTFDTKNALGTAGAKLASWANAGTEKAYFDHEGRLYLKGPYGGIGQVHIAPTGGSEATIYLNASGGSAGAQLLMQSSYGLWYQYTDPASNGDMNWYSGGLRMSLSQTGEWRNYAQRSSDGYTGITSAGSGAHSGYIYTRSESEGFGQYYDVHKAANIAAATGFYNAAHMFNVAFTCTSGNILSVWNNSEYRFNIAARGGTTIRNDGPNTGDILTLQQGDGTVAALFPKTGGLILDSTTWGLLPPRMTTTQRNAISAPTDGLILYNATDGKLQGRHAGVWEDLGGGGGGLPSFVDEIVFKDDAATPHYWQVRVNSSGSLVTADLGTTPP